MFIFFFEEVSVLLNFYFPLFYIQRFCKLTGSQGKIKVISQEMFSHSFHIP